MKLKCIIIDDEPLARKVIQEHIEDTPFLEVVGQADNPQKALRLISGNTVDIIFLDIQMPRMNGIEFLKANKELPIVILTTAYPEYALEAFQLDVIDYLVKPIIYNRFLKAAEKAKDYIGLQRRATYGLNENTKADYFFIKCDYKLEKIFFTDILYIEGMSNYVMIHTKGKKLISYLTLKAVEDVLPQSEFIQIHRSYIVSISKIEKLDRAGISIAGTQLPVSRSLKDNLQAVIDERIVKR